MNDLDLFCAADGMRKSVTVGHHLRRGIEHPQQDVALIGLGAGQGEHHR
ncbi:hypothetical protein ACFXJ8_28180 [Nonomuraea sp. NPDC059194]